NLPAARYHLSANVRHLHLRHRRALLGTDLGVAVVAAAPHGRDQIGDLLVARAAAEHAPQVVAAGSEEAGEHLSFRGQANARAGAAERLRDGGDDADLAGAVEVAPAL